MSWKNKNIKYNNICILYIYYDNNVILKVLTYVIIMSFYQYTHIENSTYVIYLLKYTSIVYTHSIINL
jgi:hypothetical protein